MQHEDLENVSLREPSVSADARIIVGDEICAPTPASWFQRIRRSPTMVLLVCGLALFTDMVVYGVPLPILPEILRTVNVLADADISFYANLLFAVYAIGIFLATPIFGILSDRYQNRQVPMLVGLLGLALTTVLFPFASSVWALCVARFFQGISAAASWVIGMAMIADIYPPERLGSAMGIVNGIYTVGLLSGPPIGSFLAPLGIKFPFYVCGALALLDLLGRLVIKPVPFVRQPQLKKNGSTVDVQTELVQASAGLAPLGPASYYEESSSPGLDLSSQAGVALSKEPKKKSIWRRVFEHEFFMLFLIPEIILLNVCVVLSSCSFTIMEANVSTLVQGPRFLLTDPKYTLLAFGCILLPSVLTSIVIGHLSDKLPRSRILIIGIILHCFSPVLITLPDISFPAFCVACVYFGLSSSFLCTPLQPEMAVVLTRLGHHASFAKIYAIFNLTYGIGMVLGPLASAFVISTWDDIAIAMYVLLYLFLFFLPIFSLYALKLERRRAGLPSTWSDVFKNSIRDFFNPVSAATACSAP